ncbi:MAG TPA: response regulator [Rhodocyclaceae bacterium]|nr:response regulator [Rhodocyclaceae bacterium]
MNNAFTVFAVDDDPMIQDILRGILEPAYQVEVFSSAEACQAGMAAVRPDCLLLDIGLPGMDGYQFCRLLKDGEAHRDIPVTFISSHDTIDSRLKGYDAGAEDFIVKPFEPVELLRKLKVAENFVANRRSLQEQARASAALSTMAIASMGDSGLVLQYMGKLINWYDEKDIAAGTLELLHQFSVDGVVQTRVGERVHTASAAGTDLPLEVSVLNHVRTMDRIFEFRNRGVYNYGRITVMVNNMPVDDAVLCGRIRDNLAMAAQGAASRLEALETEESNRRNQEAVLQAVNAIQTTLDTLNQANLQNRYELSQMIYQFEQTLSRTFVRLGLADSQEREIETRVGEFTRQLVDQMDQSEGLQQSLEALSDKLHRLRPGQR